MIIIAQVEGSGITPTRPEMRGCLNLKKTRGRRVDGGGKTGFRHRHAAVREDRSEVGAVRNIREGNASAKSGVWSSAHSCCAARGTLQGGAELVNQPDRDL
jgi:hypothetical protein